MGASTSDSNAMACAQGIRVEHRRQELVRALEKLTATARAAMSAASLHADTISEIVERRLDVDPTDERRLEDPEYGTALDLFGTVDRVRQAADAALNLAAHGEQVPTSATLPNSACHEAGFAFWWGRYVVRLTDEDVADGAASRAAMRAAEAAWAASGHSFRRALETKECER
jgi:hypothetical protein